MPTVGALLVCAFHLGWPIALAVIAFHLAYAVIATHLGGFPVVARMPIDRAVWIGLLWIAIGFQSIVALSIGCAIAGFDVGMVIHTHVKDRFDKARGVLVVRLIGKDHYTWVPLRDVMQDLSPLDELLVMYWIHQWRRQGRIEADPREAHRYRFALNAQAWTHEP